MPGYKPIEEVLDGKAPVTKPPTAESVLPIQPDDLPLEGQPTWIEIILLVLGAAVAAYCFMRAVAGDC